MDDGSRGCCISRKMSSARGGRPHEQRKTSERATIPRTERDTGGALLLRPVRSPPPGSRLSSDLCGNRTEAERSSSEMKMSPRPLYEYVYTEEGSKGSRAVVVVRRWKMKAVERGFQAPAQLCLRQLTTQRVTDPHSCVARDTEQCLRVCRMQVCLRLMFEFRGRWMSSIEGRRVSRCEQGIVMWTVSRGYTARMRVTFGSI